VEQAKKSNTPQVARDLAKMCEELDADYLKNYGEKP
jgi:hypothetical protein